MAAAARTRPTRPSLTRRPEAVRLAALAGVAVVATALSGCAATTSGGSTSTTSGQTIVIISAAHDACWTATVDGRKHSGCGSARFSDRHGRRSAKVTRTKGGSSRVRVRLVRGGHTVDVGVLKDDLRSVIVEDISG